MISLAYNNEVLSSSSYGGIALYLAGFWLSTIVALPRDLGSTIHNLALDFFRLVFNIFDIVIMFVSSGDMIYKIKRSPSLRFRIHIPRYSEIHRPDKISYKYN